MSPIVSEAMRRQENRWIGVSRPFPHRDRASARPVCVEEVPGGDVGQQTVRKQPQTHYLRALGFPCPSR